MEIKVYPISRYREKTNILSDSYPVGSSDQLKIFSFLFRPHLLTIEMGESFHLSVVPTRMALLTLTKGGPPFTTL